MPPDGARSRNQISQAVTLYDGSVDKSASHCRCLTDSRAAVGVDLYAVPAEGIRDCVTVGIGSGGMSGVEYDGLLGGRT